MCRVYPGRLQDPLTSDSSRFVLVLGVFDLGASDSRDGGLRHPDHHLQRLLGHRRHHLPVPRAKESEQRVSH